MKRMTLIVAAVVAILPLSLATAQQQPPANTNTSVGMKTNIGIIDLAQVFKSHPTFNQQLKQLQQDAEMFKSTVQQQRQMLQTRRENLAKMDPNSAKFKNEESNLAQIAARLEVDGRNKVKEFAQREANLHYNTYQQIQGLIGRYCKQNGIRIVMTFDGSPVDPNNPDSIMRKVNASVVYHVPQKDITRPIIQYVAQVVGASTPNRK